MGKEGLNRREFLKRTAAIGGVLAAAPFINPVISEAKPLVKLPSRIVFLGDSITMDGRYVNLFEYYIRIHYPEWQGEIINMGLSSETVSGLSEPSHPFPRPYVHDRLRDVLDKTNPELAFVSYGMNCGIYHDFSEERFEAYKTGIMGIANQLKERKTEVVMLTPPPFDFRGNEKTILADGEAYSYSKPYEAYDDVLTTYGNWIKETFSKKMHVIDIHAAIEPYKEVCYDQDIVHPNFNGHFVWAHALLKNLKLLKEETVKVSVEGGMADSYAFEEKLPLSFPEKLFGEKCPAQLKDMLAEMNFTTLKIKGLPAKNDYSLFVEGTDFKEGSGKEWKKGIEVGSLMAKLAAVNDTTKEVDTLWEVVQQKRGIYDRALLNAIGHGNPHVEAVPLVEGERVKTELLEKLAEMDGKQGFKMEVKPTA
ncbi:MAG: hypothetical protein CMO01_02870 [Thalassobius sp.]|nr:hypothetical protein [Thalassovita sp.]